MRVSEIVHRLPASLDWMVLFRLAAVSRLVSERAIRGMFFLPEQTPLIPYSHVILTSGGPLLAAADGTRLVPVSARGGPTALEATPSIYDRFREQLAGFPIDEADVLGLGELPPYPPVVLFVQIGPCYADGLALFRAAPPTRGYELLQAVGVEYLGGEDVGAYYLARYRNRLSAHVLAGERAGYTRTGHCNRFFLQHGVIDAVLEQGLLRAASDGVATARGQVAGALSHLATRALVEQLALTCQPPPPGEPYPYGDVVPLGFVLAGLRRGAVDSAEPDDVAAAVRDYLTSLRRDGLWSYHRGGLVTATDSALVLQALEEPAAVEALERFQDGQGGYYPQLWAERRQPGRMRSSFGTRHWCQPDFATTCLVRGARRRAGLAETTSAAYLAVRFDHRGGLYFANPYLVDWALATALANDETAQPLRERLAGEILASMNSDYSFGLFDPAFSTALAITSLAMLGVSGRVLRLAQLRLADWMAPDGTFPPATPFYSTHALEREAVGGELPGPMTSPADPRHVLSVAGQRHALTLYHDDQRLISTAVALLALAVDGEAGVDGGPPVLPAPGACHPRYQCASLPEYVARYALPPYLLAN